MAFDRIAVLGGGAWGTALANVTARAGRTVTLWEHEAANAEQLARNRESRFLPGVRIEESIAVTRDLAQAAAADAVLLVVPAQAMRSVVKALGKALAYDLAKALASRTFRPYQSSDVRGVEIGGAAKNVLAIASGIVAGRGLGASASAALTTRGFAELVRFGRALGAKTETMMGLSGLGDLILTCSSPQSRNFSFGINLGKGLATKDIHGKTGLAEGAFTAPVLLEMAREHKVDMPISSAVAAMLADKMSVDEAIESLLARPLR